MFAAFITSSLRYVSFFLVDHITHGEFQLSVEVALIVDPELSLGWLWNWACVYGSQLVVRAVFAVAEPQATRTSAAYITKRSDW